MTKQMQNELSRRILAGARQGVEQAIEEHRRMGRSIVVSRDGQIIEIPAEEIEPRDLEPVRTPHSALRNS